MHTCTQAHTRGLSCLQKTETVAYLKHTQMSTHSTKLHLFLSNWFDYEIKDVIKMHSIKPVII